MMKLIQSKNILVKQIQETTHLYPLTHCKQFHISSSIKCFNKQQPTHTDSFSQTKEKKCALKAQESAVHGNKLG